jgi:hypothetical protein
MNDTLRLVLQDTARQLQRKLFLDETSMHRNKPSNVKRRIATRDKLAAVLKALDTGCCD